MTNGSLWGGDPTEVGDLNAEHLGGQLKCQDREGMLRSVYHLWMGDRATTSLILIAGDKRSRIDCDPSTPIVFYGHTQHADRQENDK